MNSFLRVHHTLPCGHVLDHQLVAENPAAFDMALAAHLVGWWLKDKTLRHQCELVNADNPYGIAPKPEKK